eukprot:CAMPEP_0117419596 /NCGR_PEP_ID=MMETSP0758-20121206/1120_1 /TAXON_ID=63605 /ORGANISM="Percolomonas cosmopolitus, Strain AE-1 (ATCC 50343)" /LENGTH=219 /DNA_ID=CAMNT_0005200743 /DNA_START=445 /DNA_END=1100 /DNA_ORIENTATION=+
MLSRDYEELNEEALSLEREKKTADETFEDSKRTYTLKKEAYTKLCRRIDHIDQFERQEETLDIDETFGARHIFRIPCTLSDESFGWLHLFEHKLLFEKHINYKTLVIPFSVISNLSLVNDEIHIETINQGNHIFWGFFDQNKPLEQAADKFIELCSISKSDFNSAPLSPSFRSNLGLKMSSEADGDEEDGTKDTPYADGDEEDGTKDTPYADGDEEDGT